MTEENVNADDYCHSGKSYYRAGKLNEAIEEFTKAMELREDAEDYLWRGKTYNKNENLEAAIEDLTKAIELGNIDGYLWRGRTYYEKGNQDAAIEDLTKAMELRSEKNCADYYWRGRAYCEKGNYAAAIEDLTKSMELRDEESYKYDDYYWRGRAYFGKRDYAAAIEDLTKAMELRNEAYGNWKSQCAEDNYDNIEFFKRSIKLRDKQYADSCEAAMEEIERAISLFQEIIQAVSSVPLNEKALNEKVIEFKKNITQQLTGLMEAKEAFNLMFKIRNDNLAAYEELMAIKRDKGEKT
jgi:tetratricopeptide (TPR) repeat protein